ncbi:carbohydrate kinase family protein [Actinomyces radicidentis]|uniref:carbohydrate kinase family protein n=1 Tax=Actinomyces radicidentis TaxID=111015 RepID=UPI0026DF00C0|nr:PfkB family carbohydrate kinase [Actinomyces radicidentis]
MSRLAVIGDVVQDIVVWQREEVRPATDTESEIFVQRGGSAANVAAFAGPRVTTRFIGSVGDDLAGLVVTRELEGHGVEALMQVNGPATGTIVLQIDLSGERNMFPFRGASGLLHEIDREWLDDVDLLHVTAYSFETDSPRQAIIEAARRVHEAGGRVSLDVSSVYTVSRLGRERFIEVLCEIAPDVITANEDETDVLGLAHDDAPGPLLATLPGVTLLARNGARATRVFREGELLLTVPVEPAEEIRDLTGCGDAFNAGYLASLLNHGDDPERNVLDAHTLARRVLACPGATEGPVDA